MGHFNIEKLRKYTITKARRTHTASDARRYTGRGCPGIKGENSSMKRNYDNYR